MAAGSTYTPIATTTLGSAAASITLSSIPSTYTYLVLVLNGSLTTSGSSVWVRFNGDTATNYSSTILYGTGTAAGSTRETSVSNGCVFAGYQQGMSTSQSTAIMHIQNYANTTTYKTTLARYSDASQEAETAVGLWRKTPEAINSLTAVVVFGSRVFSIGTTLTLYGIAAA